MVTLHIEHPITDYAIWRTAFDGLADRRRLAGVRAERISRPVDDPRFIVVALDFDAVEQAASFRGFLETQVWSSPTRAPALDGRPVVRILEPAPAAVGAPPDR